ncbi:hypothetical protein G9A89_021455 [Geosiphon pyriformis]|nr:hypothetical protein G9A89_021451 [Geosiphon pyriformis]KAG9304675.1 hypothetical protein G9A89_021455 [Geosiphon pyriformis]
MPSFKKFFASFFTILLAIQIQSAPIINNSNSHLSFYKREPSDGIINKAPIATALPATAAAKIGTIAPVGLGVLNPITPIKNIVSPLAVSPIGYDGIIGAPLQSNLYAPIDGYLGRGVGYGNLGYGTGYMGGLSSFRGYGGLC